MQSQSAAKQHTIYMAAHAGSKVRSKKSQGKKKIVLIGIVCVIAVAVIASMAGDQSVRKFGTVAAGHGLCHPGRP